MAFDFSLYFRLDFSIEIGLVREPAVSQSSYGSLTFSLVWDSQCCFNKPSQVLKLELLSTISNTTRSTPKNYAGTLRTEPGVARPLFYIFTNHRKHVFKTILVQSVRQQIGHIVQFDPELKKAVDGHTPARKTKEVSFPQRLNASQPVQTF